jgi:hypothetical protein
MAGILNIEIGGTWSSPDTAAVSISGFTTSAAYYLNIYTVSPARHAGVWDGDKYNLIANGSPLTIYDDFVWIDGLQISSSLATGTEFINCDAQAASSWLRFSNLIIKGIGGSSEAEIGLYLQSANPAVYVWNTIFYKFSTAASGSNSPIYIVGGTALIYSTTSIGGYRGINNGGGTVTCKNCYSGGCASDCYYGTITKTTCASSDATGSVGLQNIAVNTTQFVNVTAGSENYHLAGTGSALYNVGTDTSGDAAPMNFATDIDGQTRDATWDIGADAWYVAPSTMINNVLIIIHFPRLI